MLDKTSKKLLSLIEEMLATAPEHFIWFGALYDKSAEQLGMSEADTLTCIKYLLEKGVLISAKSSSGRHIGVYPSHEIKHKKEFAWLGVKKYLLANWIAILALFISTAAFIRTLF